MVSPGRQFPGQLTSSNQPPSFFPAPFLILPPPVCATTANLRSAIDTQNAIQRSQPRNPFPLRFHLPSRCFIQSSTSCLYPSLPDQCCFLPHEPLTCPVIIRDMSDSNSRIHQKDEGGASPATARAATTSNRTKKKRHSSRPHTQDAQLSNSDVNAPETPPRGPSE